MKIALFNNNDKKMKKSSFIIILLTVVTLLVSCTSTNQTLEKKAEKEMMRKMSTITQKPQLLKINNVETVYLEDSICILNYDISTNNSDYKKWEFVYKIQSDGNEIAFYTELNDDVESILTFTKKSYYKMRDDGLIPEKVSDMDYRKWLLSFQVLLRQIDVGFYIVGEDDCYYKLDENGDIQMYKFSDKPIDYIDTW